MCSIKHAINLREKVVPSHRGCRRGLSEEVGRRHGDVILLYNIWPVVITPTFKSGADGIEMAATSPHPGTTLVSAETPLAVSLPARAEDTFDPQFKAKLLSTMRRKIGQRLAEGKAAAPHFYVSAEVGVDRIFEIRSRQRENGEQVVPSLNDFIIRAAALALMEVPELNSRINGNDLHIFNRADVAFAVALPIGLVAPVIRAADAKPLRSITDETRTIIERARINKLSPDDYRGGTFTVSNLGGFRVREFVAIINPPQAGILAIGQATTCPVYRDGAVVPQRTLVATLSADHRIIDGATGARFLGILQDLLESPERLLN